MKKSLLITLSILVVLLITFSGIRIYKSIIFNQQCEGYLKRAADSNNVETAKKELSKSIKYLESHKLTKGYTSVLYRTPSEDLSFWYNNLKQSYDSLDQLNEKTSELEKSNMLMKLRETLLDDGETGTKITVPNGITIYPYNTTFSCVLILILGIMILCFLSLGILDILYGRR